MTFADNFEQSKSGHYYTNVTMADFLSAVGDLPVCGNKTKYMNVPCSFDIETTSTEVAGIPCGTMYVWSFCLNGAVYLGRTYADLLSLLSAISAAYGISDKKRLRIYVRNLGFEFQFIRRHFTWTHVFARQTREPMSALTSGGLEFRCSMVLTNQKLAQTAKELIHFPVAKLVGDLDYRLPRHCETPLTDKEIQYSINDVLIDASLIYDRIISDGDISRIPLTATSYTRRLCRKNCMPYRSKERWNYARNIARLTMTKAEYLCALFAFAGGYTHASPLSAMSDDLYDVASLDFTSAYPAAMVCEAEFPMSRGFEIDPTTITSREQLIQKAQDFAFIGTFEFYNIDSKSNVDYYISVSKTHNAKNVESFNGRLASADFITICLTHIDFLMILKTYNVGGVRVRRLWQYRKGYLPKPYIMTVLTQYGKKTELKDVAGMEAEYLQGKRDTNCLYGMLVTQIDRPDVVYHDDTGEWTIDAVDIEEKLDKYNTDENRFLSYLWGIMVTAICRRNLWGAILTVGADYHYSDTDSVKITNYDKHKWYFDEYNREIDAKMKAAADVVGFDFALTRPKTIKGKEKPLGQWDFEGVYSRAKFLNAKRYIYVQNGELHVTIAGTGKQSTAQYLLDTYGTIDNIFEHFDDGLTIKGEYTAPDGTIKSGTGKLTHIYNDNAVDFELTDYTGKTAHVHEESSIALLPCDYAIGFPAAFLKFVSQLADGLYVKPEIPCEIVQNDGEL